MNFSELFATYAISPALRSTRIDMVRKALQRDDILDRVQKERVVELTEELIKQTLLAAQQQVVACCAVIPENIRDAYVLPLAIKQLEMTFAASFRDTTTELAVRARGFAND